MNGAWAEVSVYQVEDNALLYFKEKALKAKRLGVGGIVRQFGMPATSVCVAL